MQRSIPGSVTISLARRVTGWALWRPLWWPRLRRNRMGMAGLILAGVLTLVAILAPVLSPADPYEVHLGERLRPPSLAHPAGTDDLGRDQLARILYGSRVSLLVGFLSPTISGIIGVAMGALAGYFGGRIDSLIMRLCDVLFAIPDLLLAIAVVFVLGPGLQNVFIALAAVGWAGLARIVRGEVLSRRNLEYVEAARAAGASELAILFRHVLPNSLAPVIVWFTLSIPGAIMAEAGLSFLGLGVQPPVPSWGQMISFGRGYLRSAPWLSVLPGFALGLTVLAFNLLGDAVRDAVDPRLKP